MGFLCTATDKYPCARAKICLFPRFALSMACQHPASPGSISLQEESSCRLHCKTMCGLLLGYSRNKQLLLRLSQAFAAKPMPGAAPFAILSSLAPRAVQGGRGYKGRQPSGGCWWGSPHLSSTFPCRSSCYRNSRPGGWDTFGFRCQLITALPMEGPMSSASPSLLLASCSTLSPTPSLQSCQAPSQVGSSWLPARCELAGHCWTQHSTER